MKFFHAIAFVSVVFCSSCTKDNFKKPTSTITGRVVYQNNPIGVRTNSVQLELWQSGYQLYSKVAVYVNQDGTFSAEMFDGNYKLTRLKGNGPWMDNTDTINVQLNGSATVDVPVTPYYTIQNEVFTFNKADTTISATFGVTQVVPGKAIEKISLSVGLTQFVDLTNQIPILNNDFNPPANVTQPITLTLSVNPNRYPNTAANAELRRQLGIALTQQYGYVRVGVKTVGVTERVYSTVKKTALQ
jgi:hypothetical protein